MWRGPTSSRPERRDPERQPGRLEDLSSPGILLHSEARLLPTPSCSENFNFYGKTLTRRRTRCGRAGSAAWISPTPQLGEALGQKFVERTFGKEGKERTLKMVDALEKALGQDIQGALVDERRPPSSRRR